MCIFAINKLGKLSKNARLPEYDALISELQKVEKKANTGISNYIFSINEKYLSDNVKAMSGKLLFVEYGNITLQGQVVTNAEVEPYSNRGKRIYSVKQRYNKRNPDDGRQPCNFKHYPRNHAARTRFTRSMPGHQTPGVSRHHHPGIPFNFL